MWVRAYKIALCGTKGVGKQTLINAISGRAIGSKYQPSVVVPYISYEGGKIMFDFWNGDYKNAEYYLHIQRDGIPNTRTVKCDQIIKLPNDENKIPEFAENLMNSLFKHLRLGKPFRL